MGELVCYRLYGPLGGCTVTSRWCGDIAPTKMYFTAIEDPMAMRMRNLGGGRFSLGALRLHFASQELDDGAIFVQPTSRLAVWWADVICCAERAVYPFLLRLVDAAYLIRYGRLPYWFLCREKD